MLGCDGWRGPQELAVTVGGCWQFARGLPGVDELVELGFGEDCYAEGFGFVELGAGVFAYYDVGGFFAYGAAGFAAVGDYQGFGFFAAAFGEGAGEDEGHAGEAVGHGGLAFFFHVYADGAEMFDQFAIGGFGEKFADAFGYFRAYFGDFH